MVSPKTSLWSFTYCYEGGRYSFEIPAPSQQDAEARVKALENAICEGSIIPFVYASAEMRPLWQAAGRGARSRDLERRAAIVTEVELGKVAVQVSLAAMLIDADHAALKH